MNRALFGLGLLVALMLPLDAGSGQPYSLSVNLDLVAFNVRVSWIFR